MANYTILLIDYEPRSIERFRDPLTAAGYKVEIATDGISGIAAFHRLNPDMVLVEAMIPKKHGFEVCQELKRTPHGRRTPVLITTGVYKGRKYRTQALHIYGCDEYIEKPIAAEQLLEIVSKFFGPGSAGSAARSDEPTAAAGGPSGDRGAKPGGAPETTAGMSTEPSPEKDAPSKPAGAHKSTVTDDTEGEIIARLDAILPDVGFAPELERASAGSMIATIEQPVEQTVEERADPLEEMSIAVEPAVEDDPFAQMRAELDAELGSLSAALAVELGIEPDPVHEPMPSDQAVSPSVLEALPAPEADIAPAPEIDLAPAPAPPAAPPARIEKPGEIVSFDNKRSRKHKKSGASNKGATSQLAMVAPAPVRATPSPVAPIRPLPEMRLPKGTLVESALATPAPRAGVPGWVWAIAAAGVVIAGVYLALSPGGKNQAETRSPAAMTEEILSSAPAEPKAEPEATIPASTDTTVAARSVDRPGSPPIAAPPIPAAPPASERTEPVVEPKKAAVAPAKVSLPISKALAAWPASKATDKAKLKQPEAPVGLDPEGSVAGIEAIAEVAAPAPVTTVAPGTLLPIDEADVAPVALQRKLPTYSLQARQMRLAGTVVMNVLVNENGSVDQVVLVSGVSGADVNDSAMRAARSWTYRPATKDGVPVKVWKSEQIVFKP